MATPADRQAVKSLNNFPGKKKFVFKKFSQRINDIDIKVFRSFDRVKAEPSSMEQTNREIRERLPFEAAEVAKKESFKDDDHDDAFRVVMGSKTSVLEGQVPSRGGE